MFSRLASQGRRTRISAAVKAFRPPLLLRSRHLQTIFATTGPRRWLQRRTWQNLERRARQIVLDAGNGIRLSGMYTGHDDGPRDLVTVIHGWEGGSKSLYVRSAAGFLYDRGYDIVRLHLRDHGGSYDLNREPFTCTRLDEVVSAVDSIGKQFAQRRHFLLGFSLGGNFALRVGLRAGDASIPLAKVIAVCPAILPHRTMDDLEAGFFLYRDYFLYKWKRTLRRKLALFPDLGYAEALRASKSLRAMNDYFVPRLTPYSTPLEYFMGYAIGGDVLAGLHVPSHIIVSADDPVIDVSHVDALARPDCLTVEVVARGGHCGFIKNFRMQSWIDERIADILGAVDS